MRQKGVKKGKENKKNLSSSNKVETAPNNDITQHLYTTIHDRVLGTTFDLLRDVQIQQETTLQAITKVKNELGDREAEMREVGEIFEKMQLYVRKLGITRSNMAVLDANMAKTKRMVEGIRGRLKKTSDWGHE
ncbi:hypothetical protein LSM04_002007 [Trypanosoma melophagium]|uniref:uncharacterized protein n=1 Tax=Trypanosoma melophagium TaxID=715481 RepID=UPI00351A5E0E|nr:hypothetical protein LSM04_002007 [Trypanosoma melophagium]